MGRERHGRHQRRYNTTLANIGLGRCFTMAQLVAALAISTLVFSSSMVSSKTPSLMPKNMQHRRRPSVGSGNRNSNYNTIVSISTSSNRSREAAWVSGFKNSLASGLAAGCSKLILAPFDTIKTLQQAALASGKSPLSLSKTAQEILKRPKGFLEFYVSSYCLKVYQNYVMSRYVMPIPNTGLVDIAHISYLLEWPLLHYSSID